MVEANRDIKPGFRFKNFKITNGRVFKDVTIPLANQGIVSILGHNGAGKSTIWNLFEATIFATTPYGHKKDDLVKNKDDASFVIDFDRSEIPHVLASERKKKKWGYRIEKDGEDQTPHTYNDSVKAAGSILGITQPEFEGSIHLTQGAQHILISGKPAKRKEYISTFFGIDTSYDLVHQESKAKLQATKDEITKVSALSHTKTMLEQEIELENYQDPAPLEAKLTHWDDLVTTTHAQKTEFSRKIETYAVYHIYLDDSSKYCEPVSDLESLEKKLVTINATLMSADKITKSNKNGREVNKNIDYIEAENEKLLKHLSGLEDLDLAMAIKHQEKLIRQRTANMTVMPLRAELATLPDQKMMPIETIEAEVAKVRLDHQVAKRKLASIRLGECDQCGSQFEANHITEVEAEVADLEECYQTLLEDCSVIKTRNTAVLRRTNILKTLNEIPEFTDEDSMLLADYRRRIPAKRTYDENVTTLGILQRVELQEEVNTQDLINKREELCNKIADVKVCAEAQRLIPAKPEEELETLEIELTEAIDQIALAEAKKADITEELGKVRAANQRIKRLQNELATISKKLSKVEKLKKDEFYWAKMVDAYGPRGLRVRQLEKMMNLVIRRLPVYTSILFNEKGLTFKHKCDASSVEIIACREEINPVTGETTTFEHDISSFSGGEKGKMSTAFVLTLADCVPPAKRSNILILDEVDSALDADGQFRFTNDLLPMLKTNYESVFVVSHSQEIQQAAVYDQVWTLKKDNHWSEVIKEGLDPC